MPNNRPPALKLALCGFCIMCLALGLGRFAYTPLLPVLVAQHWLTESTAGFVGSMNFFGYLFGAILSTQLLHFKPAQFWIKQQMLVCTLSLLACTIHWNPAWLIVCRTLAGFSGAILMVLTPPVIYHALRGRHIAWVSGIVFGGIGLGIMFGSIVVPWLSATSITLTWGIIGLAAVPLTIIGWRTLPSSTHPDQARRAEDKLQHTHIQWHTPIVLLLVAYLLFGYGAVPHLLYMVTYLEQSLHATDSMANIGWFLYGVGNCIGSPIFGWLANRLGKGPSLCLTYLIAAGSIALLFTGQAVNIGIWSYALNGLVANSIVSLTSSYLSTMAPMRQQTHFWSIFTIVVALSQSGGSAIMANWIGTTQGYHQMFGSTTLAMLCAALLVAIVYTAMRHQQHKSIE